MVHHSLLCYVELLPNFLIIVYRLKSKFPHDNLSTNPGYVLSPVISQRDAGGDNGGSVKVSIEISDSQQPVTFTCDGEFLTLSDYYLNLLKTKTCS